MIWILTDRRYLRQRMPLAAHAWLEAKGVETRLIVADEGERLSRLTPIHGPNAVSPWHDLRASDVVLARSRHPLGLALLKEAEARGAQSVNPWAGVIKIRNKVRATLALARRGIPVPVTYLADSPESLRDVPRAHYPLVLKPFQGDNAAGIVIVPEPSALQSMVWRDPLVLAQPYVETGGIDLKLYVAAELVWAIRRRSPLTEGSPLAEPTHVTSDLKRLARACGLTFGLNLLGIDVLETAEGPLVVDVNDFPNYTGIDVASEVVGQLVLARAAQANAEGASGRRAVQREVRG